MPLILLLTGIITAVAVVVSLAQTKEYEATARVVLSQTDPINAVIDPTTPINYDPESDRNTRVSLIKLEAVAEAVRQEANVDYSTSELLDKVTTEVESNSDIVLIKALDPDPETAAAIATGFAEQYQLYRQETRARKPERRRHGHEQPARPAQPRGAGQRAGPRPAGEAAGDRDPRRRPARRRGGGRDRRRAHGSGEAEADAERHHRVRPRVRASRSRSRWRWSSSIAA